MDLFFVDESGTLPPKQKIDKADAFVLGGIILPEEIWHKIDKEFCALKEKFGVKGEIKWRFFSPQKLTGPLHSLSHLSLFDKEKLRLSLYNLILQFNSIYIIGVVVDVKKAYELANIYSHNDLYWHSYKQLTECFQTYLENISKIKKNKTNGIIVCDHRQPKDDHQLRLSHQNFLRETKEINSSDGHLIEEVFIAPSDFSVGIQLADLAVGAIYRNYVRKDCKYFELIEDATKWRGNQIIEQSGIIQWPK